MYTQGFWKSNHCMIVTQGNGSVDSGCEALVLQYCQYCHMKKVINNLPPLKKKKKFNKSFFSTTESHLLFSNHPCAVEHFHWQLQLFQISSGQLEVFRYNSVSGHFDARNMITLRDEKMIRKDKYFNEEI